MDRYMLSVQTRTVPGLFGIPVGQIKMPGGVWMNTPPGVYERVTAMKAQWRKGSGPDLTPDMALLARMANEYKRLEGLALESSNYSLLTSTTYPGYLRTADITATHLDIFEEAGYMALNAVNKEPSSYDDSAVEDWAKSVAFSTALLASLKYQYNLLAVCPLLTRSDAGAGYVPFTKTGLTACENAFSDIRFPAVAYKLADILTTMVQVGGAEKLNSIDAQVMMPVCANALNVATFGDQIDALDSLQKVNMFAQYIKQPLTTLNKKWLRTPHIVPNYSDLAQAYLEMIPCVSNSGGVALFDQDYTGNVNIYYNQCLGVSPLHNAGALFREDSSGATTFFMITPNPSADKLSFRYASDRTATSLTELPDNVTRFDYIAKVAEARTAAHRGIFGWVDNYMQYHTIQGDESSWDRKLSRFIYSLMYMKKFPVVSLARLLPALTPVLGKPGIKIATATQKDYGNR